MEHSNLQQKARILYLIIVIVLVPLGFTTKFYRGTGEAWMHAYGGDIVYPVFWYFCVLVFFPRLNSLRTAAGVFFFCTAVELTQLYSWPSLLWLRRSFLGRTLVGSSFALIDLKYYALGCIFAVLLRRWLYLLFLPHAAAEPQRHDDAF